MTHILKLVRLLWLLIQIFFLCFRNSRLVSKSFFVRKCLQDVFYYHRNDIGGCFFFFRLIDFQENKLSLTLWNRDENVNPTGGMIVPSVRSFLFITFPSIRKWVLISCFSSVLFYFRCRLDPEVTQATVSPAIIMDNKKVSQNFFLNRNKNDLKYYERSRWDDDVNVKYLIWFCLRVGKSKLAQIVPALIPFHSAV